MLIRDFVTSDAQKIVEILRANQQYGHPELDGPEAMVRVHECPAAEFLVAEEDMQVVGFIRGVYDGSRALIHIASVQPEYQRRGIGQALVKAIGERFLERGATSIMVTVPGEMDFWRRLGFRLTTRVMTAYPIESLLKRLA
ncbi:MAG: GNAT family N-acetyltransferase [Chloroflexi bacterium]|nr:GNAT family N-acetyltransferase [Chloroflexota bacterium]